MKRLVVLGLVGLLLGMAGAVGIVVVREKQARAAAAPIAADSTSVHGDTTGGAIARSDTVPADSLDPHAIPADTLPDDAALDPPAAPAGEAGTVTATGAGGAGSRSDSLRAEVAVAGSGAGPDEQRLARIFAAMRPEEAARVLEEMSDPEIRLLLSHLRERQAAAIMSNISPERAAVISSAVIRGERSMP